MSPYLVGREDNGCGLRLALHRVWYAEFSELGALRVGWGWPKRVNTDLTAKQTKNSFLKLGIILYRKTGVNKKMKTKAVPKKQREARAKKAGEVLHQEFLDQQRKDAEHKAKYGMNITKVLFRKVDAAGITSTELMAVIKYCPDAEVQVGFFSGCSLELCGSMAPNAVVLLENQVGAQEIGLTQLDDYDIKKLKVDGVEVL